MGVSNSKAEACEALRLCKERKKFIKQAIDSRYNLAAAHVAYIQSLQNIGIALRKFAESEASLDSSQTPPSLPQTGGATGGGGGGQSDSPQPHTPSNPTVNYMKSSGVSAVTINLNPSSISNSNKVYVDDLISSPLTMSPPQPPPPPPRFSWDYFEPAEGSFRFMGHARLNETNAHEQLTEKDTDFGGSVTPPESLKSDQILQQGDTLVANEANGVVLLHKKDQTEQDSKIGCLSEEQQTEGLMTHNAKDFLSSIKEIENHFLRAAKSGNEVSRMLEANKIQISYSDANGSSTGSSMSLLTCFRGETTLVLHESPQTVKAITWKRTLSAHPSGTPSSDDDENNFVEELCMIAGRHSSTLDRLYAWERKLYDEVKASESIRKEYDRKCDQVRHQFVKDLKPHVIDKTRSDAKDLHSRMTVALHSVNSISKRIEKIRDEELQQQLIELIQGLIRMWKTMLECHHAQYITVSLAYHSRTGTRHNKTKNQIMEELQHEVECFVLSFTDLLKCYTSYVESINGWLQNCITQPKERVKSRRAFSPRRAVAPPIFVICRDWTVGMQSLPSQKLSDAIKDFLSQLRRISFEELEKKQMVNENGEETKDDDVNVTVLDLNMIQLSLSKVLDRLARFSEASVKLYEDIKQNSETAENVYANYRPPPRAYSI